jgi:glyoxylase-like metal-dependent hydrolase (beta-lactamase superfamily II)
MAEYAALEHGIYCVDALYVHPQVASIYLLREGDEVAIIETGTYHSVSNVLATLEALNIAKSQVKYVIPTHVHLDHAGGASEMIRHFREASLIIHPRGAVHMIDPQKLIAGTIGVYGEEKFKQLYGTIEPIAEDRIIIAEDLACFELSKRELVFIDTPGHARHHFCIYDQVSAGVFTGDTFGISYAAMKQLDRGLVPTTPPTQFDPQSLHESVTRIMSFRPTKLYLTHYGEFKNPAAQVASFHRWIDAYVALCERENPALVSADKDFEAALGEMILGEVDGGDTNDDIARVLKTDIRLNAQGLAHWWRNTQIG